MSRLMVPAVALLALAWVMRHREALWGLFLLSPIAHILIWSAILVAMTLVTAALSDAH